MFNSLLSHDDFWVQSAALKVISFVRVFSFFISLYLTLFYWDMIHILAAPHNKSPLLVGRYHL